MQAERTAPERNDAGLVPRRARKPWNCHGSGGHPNHQADDCTVGIAPGEEYIECLWEAAAYESGVRVCLPCAREFYGWKD